jgi:hypothetical protein
MSTTTTATNYRSNTGSPVKDLVGIAQTGKTHRSDGTHRTWCRTAYHAPLADVRVWECGETVTGDLCTKCFK